MEADEISHAIPTVEIEPGVSLRISDLEDSFVAYGWNELNEAAQLLSLLKPGMTFFDVGANIGIYSLLAANRMGMTGAIHAFEPTPRTATRLATNVSLNGFQNIIKINQVALSDSRGIARLYISDEQVLNSLATVSGQSISVPTKTLDEYVEETRVSA